MQKATPSEIDLNACRSIDLSKGTMPAVSGDSYSLADSVTFQVSCVEQIRMVALGLKD